MDGEGTKQKVQMERWERKEGDEGRNSGRER